MYFQQSDLLQGMSKDFIKEFMDIAVKESHKSGFSLFLEGDRANHFYVLLKGRIRLTMGEDGQTVYRIDNPGEAFGWSSLVGRDVYSASAECREPTKLLKINVKKLHQILEKEPENGHIFFKRLADTLGNRLIQTYRMISSMPHAAVSPSYGTGYVQESEATIT